VAIFLEFVNVPHINMG
jgi:hypothetical protein